MLKGAMIGFGNIAVNGHLPAWNSSKDFQITAVCDPVSERKKDCEQYLPQAKFYQNVSELLEKETLDFVDICTPPFKHCEMIQLALRKNLHIICEKPLVLNESEMSLLESKMKESKSLVFTVHNWNYAPLCRKVTELVRKKSVGNIRHCAWFVLRNGPAQTKEEGNWRVDPAKAGGGILIDHGWHAFYLALNWLEKEPKNVSATLENRQYEDLPVEDTAKIKIEFENNTSPLTAEIFLTWASRLRRNWGVLEGEEGTIQIEDNSVRLLKKDASSQNAAEFCTFDRPLSEGSHHPDWFQFVTEEFLNELNQPAARGKNLKVAKFCLKLIERSKESHRKGVPLSV